MLSLAVETDWDCQYFYTISSYVLLTSGSGWLAAQGTLVAIAVYRLQGDEGICRVGDGLFCSRFQNRYDAFHWPIWVWTLLKVILKKTEIHIPKDTKRIPSVWTPEIIQIHVSFNLNLFTSIKHCSALLKNAHMFRMDHGLHKFQDVGLGDLDKLRYHCRNDSGGRATKRQSQHERRLSMSSWVKSCLSLHFFRFRISWSNMLEYWPAASYVSSQTFANITCFVHPPHWKWLRHLHFIRRQNQK